MATPTASRITDFQLPSPPRASTRSVARATTLANRATALATAAMAWPTTGIQPRASAATPAHRAIRPAHLEIWVSQPAFSCTQFLNLSFQPSLRPSFSMTSWMASAARRAAASLTSLAVWSASLAEVSADDAFSFCSLYFLVSGSSSGVSSGCPSNDFWAAPMSASAASASRSALSAICWARCSSEANSVLHTPSTTRVPSASAASSYRLNALRSLSPAPSAADRNSVAALPFQFSTEASSLISRASFSMASAVLRNCRPSFATSSGSPGTGSELSSSTAQRWFAGRVTCRRPSSRTCPSRSRV